MRIWTTTALAVLPLALTACGSAEPLTRETAPTQAEVSAEAFRMCTEDMWSESPGSTDEAACQASFMTGATAAVDASIDSGTTTFDAETDDMCLSDACLGELMRLTVQNQPRLEDPLLAVQAAYVFGVTWVEEWIADGGSAA